MQGYTDAECDEIFKIAVGTFKIAQNFIGSKQDQELCETDD